LAAAGLLVLADACGGAVATLGNGDGGTSSGSSGGSTSSSGGSTSSSGGSTSSSGASGSSSGGSSSSSGASSSSSGGSTSSSGGSSSSSGASSSSSGGSSGGAYGYVEFLSCTGSGALCPSPNQQFYAGFYASSGGGNQGCTSTSAGSCVYYDCTNQTGATSDNAGTMFASGPGLNSTGIAYTSSGYQTSGSGSLVAGQTYSAKWTGATVPSFGVSVVAPAAVVLGTPAISGNTYTIPTTGDLLVTWKGGQAGNLLLLEGTAAAGGTSYFTCEWDASTGQATVPHAILSPLAGQTGGYLLFGQMATSTVSVGAYTVQTLALPYSGGSLTFK
jgi:hypothetical protein